MLEFTMIAKYFNLKYAVFFKTKKKSKNKQIKEKHQLLNRKGKIKN